MNVIRILNFTKNGIELFCNEIPWNYFYCLTEPSIRRMGLKSSVEHTGLREILTFLPTVKPLRNVNLAFSSKQTSRDLSDELESLRIISWQTFKDIRLQLLR